MDKIHQEKLPISAALQVSRSSLTERNSILNAIKNWAQEETLGNEKRNFAFFRFQECIENGREEIDLRNLNLSSLPSLKPACIKSYLLKGNNLQDKHTKTAFNQPGDIEIFPDGKDDSWNTFHLNDWRKTSAPSPDNIIFKNGEQYFIEDGDYFVAIQEDDIFIKEIARQNAISTQEFHDKKVTPALYDTKNYIENSYGLLMRNNFPVLYRADTTPPEMLVKGFHPSTNFAGIDKMIEGDALITSGSLNAAQFYGKSNIVDKQGCRENHSIYAIAVEGINAAPWIENFLYNQSLSTAKIKVTDGTLGYDEVHADNSKITADKIYILSSTNPNIQRRLAFMMKNNASEKGKNHFPFGVGIMDYHENLKQYPKIDALPKAKDYIRKVSMGQISCGYEKYRWEFVYPDCEPARDLTQ